jgi:ribose transport system substrate-binding protein
MNDDHHLPIIEDHLSRRSFLKTAALTGVGLAFGANPLLEALAQSRFRPGEGPASALALSASEIRFVKTRKWRFGFNMNHRTDDFINSVIDGGQETAKQYGIDLLVGDANFDAAKQLSDVEALVQQKVNAIFMIAVDADSISNAIIKANAAKIPVIIVGGPPVRGKATAVLNSTSFQGCYDATKALIKEIGGEGKIGVLNIPLALKTIKDRDNGVVQAVRETNGKVTVVATQGSFNAGELLAAAQNMIQANPDLKGIMCTWSLAITAALSAVQQSGKDIAVTGYDAEIDAMKALKTGKPASPSGKPILRATAGQQGRLQGKAGIDGLCKALLGKQIPQEILVPTIMVTSDNVEDAWKTFFPGKKTPW